MRLQLLVVSLMAAAAFPALGAGSTSDGTVTLSYPAGHWGANPAATLLGTEAAPGPGPLAGMGWWYRVEGDTRENPLPAPDSETYFPDGSLVAVWVNLDGRSFRVEETTYVFDQEGPSGAVRSRLKVTNNGAARSFTAFHYLDPSVSGTASGDSGQALTFRYLKFSEGGDRVRYSAPYADAFMARPAPQIRNLLNDASVTSLDNSGLPAGPGDLEATLSWSLVMSAGSGGLFEVLVSSRLPADHVPGAFRDSSPQAGLLYGNVGGGSSWYQRGFRRTTALSMDGQGAAEPPGFEFAALDDLNGDLRDDRIGRNPLTGELVVNYWTPVTGAPPPPANWRLSATGDFNADGRADLLWRNVVSQKLAVWFMNGATRIGAAAPTPDQAAHANWAVAGAADFNADGWNDILWYNQSSGNVVIWYMNAALQRITGVFTNPTTVGSLAWRVVAVGDFGKGGGAGAVWNTPDIVWQNDSSGKIVVWHMDAAATRTAGVFTSPDTLGAGTVILGPR